MSDIRCPFDSREPACASKPFTGSISHSPCSVFTIDKEPQGERVYVRCAGAIFGYKRISAKSTDKPRQSS